MSDRDKMAGTRMRARVTAFALIAAAVFAAAPAHAAGNLNVDFVVKVGQPYAGGNSSLAFAMSGGDLDRVAVGVNYLIPAAFNFALSSLRPAQTITGAPATTCTDIYSGASPRRLERAEAVGAGEGMRVAITSGTPSSRNIHEYGYRNPSATNKRNPSMAFVKYDPATKTSSLCAYLYSDTAPNKEFIVPITLTQLPTGGQYGWSMNFSLAPVYKSAGWTDPTILIQQMMFDAYTAGNWNGAPTDPWGGVPLVSTPVTPGDYQFGANFTVCKTTTSTTTATGCTGDFTEVHSKTRIVPITVAPIDGIVHPYAKFSTVAGVGGLTKQLTPGYSAIATTKNISIKWSVQAPPADHTVRGYVLAIAKPGRRASEYFDYLITQKTQVDQFNEPLLDINGAPVPTPGYQAGICATLTCTRTLQFPLTGIGGEILDGEGKYDIAVVTLYADGHRSDGRFDPQDPITREALCPLTSVATDCLDGKVEHTKPAFSIEAPGVSYWAAYVAQDEVKTIAWQNATFNYTGKAGSYVAPKFLLFLDPLRRAQFIKFNPYVGSDATVFSATPLVQANGSNGPLQFGSIGTAGATTWTFVGEVTPGSVYGVFTLLDPKNPNLGAALTDPSKMFAAMPVANADLFQGVR